MLTKILVAVDGSEHADRALAMACDIAGKYHAELHLIHVPQFEGVPMPLGAGAPVLPETFQAMEDAGDRVLEEAIEAANARSCRPATAATKHGDPATVIQERASEVGADLLVMGRRGRGSLTGLLLGSVSQKLAQVSPCALLTVE